MNEAKLALWRKAGAISGEAREMGARMIKEGALYLDVAEEVEDYIRRKGGKLAFPVNISVNDVAAHYSPCTGDQSRFRNGDLVKLDVGAHVDGCIGDTAITVEVGTKNYQNLIESSRKALRMAIEIAGDGVPVGTIGGTIERSIKGDGFQPVVNLTGHEMECYNLHAGLTVPNVDDGDLSRIKDGMVIAIEPFATDGHGQVRNGKPGNIFRVLRERPMRDKKAMEFFLRIRSEFGRLPFCERWCTRLDENAVNYLHILVRHGLISSYPILNEVKGGMVSQTEHTILVANGRTEITTLSE